MKIRFQNPQGRRAARRRKRRRIDGRGRKMRILRVRMLSIHLRPDPRDESRRRRNRPLLQMMIHTPGRVDRRQSARRTLKVDYMEIRGKDQRRTRNLPPMQTISSRMSCDEPYQIPLFPYHNICIYFSLSLSDTSVLLQAFTRLGGSCLISRTSFWTGIFASQ